MKLGYMLAITGHLLFTRSPRCHAVSLSRVFTVAMAYRPRSLDPETIDTFIANYRAVAGNMRALRAAPIDIELLQHRAMMLDLGWRGMHDDLVRFNYYVTELLADLRIDAPAEVDSSLTTWTRAGARVPYLREWSRYAPPVD